MQRGFLKYYLLKLLSEREHSGYGLMKAIEAETGFWKPSAGSIYPLIGALQEQGLIELAPSAEHDDKEKKSYRLTAAGRQAIEEARQAKAEIFASLKRALEVFARIFGDEEAAELARQMESWFKEGIPPNWGEIPRSVRPRLQLLRQTLLGLPYEELSTQQLDQVIRIIDESTRQLGRLLQDTSDAG
ncbi:MAG TPA: PadR family transcriptional regulator [Candidatus Fraserbacteria bacterium]|nr:PadR family transcriptional regulator [Candidatus Fraserbacteria bacterium]